MRLHDSKPSQLGGYHSRIDAGTRYGPVLRMLGATCSRSSVGRVLRRGAPADHPGTPTWNSETRQAGRGFFIPRHTHSGWCEHSLRGGQGRTCVSWICDRARSGPGTPTWNSET